MPDPETLEDSRLAYPGDDGDLWPLGPIEWRVWEPFDKIAAPGEDATVREWFRIRAPLPDDPALHTAALVFVSDAGSFSGIERRYGWEGVSHRASASLDHAMWIHRPVDWDGWMLMTTNTPVAHAARPLSHRQFYTRDGVHIASVAQEAIFRKERELGGSDRPGSPAVRRRFRYLPSMESYDFLADSRIVAVADDAARRVAARVGEGKLAGEELLGACIADMRAAGG